MCWFGSYKARYHNNLIQGIKNYLWKLVPPPVCSLGGWILPKEIRPIRCEWFGRNCSKTFGYFASEPPTSILRCWLSAEANVSFWTLVAATHFLHWWISRSRLTASTETAAKFFNFSNCCCRLLNLNSNAKTNPHTNKNLL